MIDFRAWAPIVIFGCRSPEGVDGAPVDANVLVLLLDDLGTDKIAAYGDHPSAPPSPTLDALAADGVLFRNTWASCICSPSRGMLLTGRYGRRFGLGLNVDADDTRWELPDEEVLIPEMLAPRGYTSFALGKWHLTPVPDRSSVLDAPLRHGFATHRGSVANLDYQTLDDHTDTDYFRWEKSIDGERAFIERYATSDLVDDAVEQIANTPEPWFGYLAFNAGHIPTHVPPDDLNVTGVTGDDPKSAQLDAMVAALDLEIGRLLDTMPSDLRARTTVVVLGDNGSEQALTTAPFDPQHAKGTMFQGGIRVPMIVVGPDVARPGTESDALVHVVDLFPTIAELAGVDLATLGAPIDGQSLVPFLRDPATPGRDWVFTERLYANGPPPWPNEILAIRDRRYKLVRAEGKDSLFDLAGRIDDGPDLLAEPVTADAARAWKDLDALLARALDAMPYDGLAE